MDVMDASYSKNGLLSFMKYLNTKWRIIFNYLSPLRIEEAIRHKKFLRVLTFLTGNQFTISIKSYP